LRGFSLARETGAVLAWDMEGWLYLLDRAGDIQAQSRVAGALAAAACSDDGTTVVAGTTEGIIWWLSPDMRVLLEKKAPRGVRTLAADPFGQYLAVADPGGGLTVLDRQGREVSSAPVPRPLHHLAFVPAAPLLLGASDIGLVACFELSGKCAWREAFVAHIGALAVDGEGETILLACFTDGLLRYSLSGKQKGRLSLPEPCRLAAVSFDGAVALVAGLSKRIFLTNLEGKVLQSHTVAQPPAAIALAALGQSALVGLPDGALISLEWPVA
jgi:hypothetical protein